MREWARLFEFASRIEEREVAQPFIFAKTLLVFERVELGRAQGTCELRAGVLVK